MLGPGQEESIVVALGFQVVMMDISQLALQDEVACRAAVKERLCITRVRTYAAINHCIWRIYREAVISHCVLRLTPFRGRAILITPCVSF